MKHSTDSRRRIRPSIWCRAGLTVCLGTAWLMAAHPCFADGPVDPHACPDIGHVASNQGVTLEGPSAPPERSSEEQQPHRTEPLDSPEAGTPGSQPDRAATTLQRPDTSRPSKNAVTLSDGKSTPWYRTGLGALGIVLSLIVIAVWALRRWVPAARVADTGVLRVVGRVGLGPKHSLALIQMGRRFVLVGISGDRLSRLSEVADSDEVAELATRAGIETKTQTDVFDDLLLHEAQPYAKIDDEKPGRASSVHTGSAPTYRSLTDLLRKLRSVKAR